MKQRGIYLIGSILAAAICTAGEYTLWETAGQQKELLRVSTLFTAQNVRDYLSTDKGIDTAIDWCKTTGITRVFIETFRSRYWAERKALEHARDRFKKAGFDVAGCVTTTNVGKRSTGWNLISCYTDVPTQETLQKIFEYTASMFDLVMIDDFLFTDCSCSECKKARGTKSWAGYRCDLMVDVSRNRIIQAARKVRPGVKIIIKYPQWYDNFHNRGYEVVRQTKDYDLIWVGTETRDYDDKRWGGKVQYEAYYIMRWLGGIGGGKCGGGWFDWLGTTERTYLEQANQTILADAREMMLFCYGGLQSSTGPDNIKLLRREMPNLFKLAKLVRGKAIQGVAAPKPPNSDPGNESYVYDFVGMMGIPLVPADAIDTDAKAAFYPVHALKDPDFKKKFRKMINAGKPVLITDGLASRMPMDRRLRPNLKILPVKGNPKSLLAIEQEKLDEIRSVLLKPLGVQLAAPNKVALYLFGDDLIGIENFNDKKVKATLTFTEQRKYRQVLVIPANGKAKTETSGLSVTMELPARTLVMLHEKA